MPSRAGSDMTNRVQRPRDLVDVPMTYALFARSWWAIIVLIVGVTALRLAYLAWVSPYTLIEDEAHYWEWSRHLDWSYYTKGPGVALVIRASTALFGDTVFAIRLPAVLASMVVTLAIAGLAADIAGDRRAGFLAALCVLCAPIFQVSAVLMTIDGPYVACWAMACWAAWRALARGSRWAWAALGFALAIGLLFKYTIVLLPPGIVLFAWMRRRELVVHAKWRRWALFGACIAIVGTLPIIVWNAQHGWVTVKHLLGHIGMPGGDVSPSNEGLFRWNPMWTLEYVGTQIAMAGGLLILGLYTAFEAIRRRKTEPSAWGGRLFLICLSLPIFTFYLGVTLFNDVEGNWPMAGFVTLLALCGWGVVDGMDRVKHLTALWQNMPQDARPTWGIFRNKPQLHRQVVWHVTVFLGLLAVGTFGRLDLAAPILDGLVSSISRIAARVGVGSGQDLKVVPVGRLTGATDLASAIEIRLGLLTELTGKQAVVIAQHYGVASQLAFYLPGHPTVYCASSLMGGRRTQYDLWAETDLRRADHLLGSPAVLVGGEEHQWDLVFDRVEPIGNLKGDHKTDRKSFIGFGYRGFGPEN